MSANDFLQICTGFTCVAVAVSWLVKGFRAANAPNRKQDERITNLEERVARHDEYFTRDKARLEAIEKGTRVSQRGMLALLDHNLDGNNTKQMQDARDELKEYLINR